jgi:hypothetical protein
MGVTADRSRNPVSSEGFVVRMDIAVVPFLMARFFVVDRRAVAGRVDVMDQHDGTPAVTDVTGEVFAQEGKAPERSVAPGARHHWGVSPTKKQVAVPVESDGTVTARTDRASAPAPTTRGSFWKRERRVRRPEIKPSD